MRTTRRRTPNAEAALPPNLRTLLELAPTPIIILNPRGDIALWNPAAERLFGWREAEVLGKPNPLVAKSEWKEYEKRLREYLKGRMDRMLRVAHAKDGRLVNLAYSTAPIANDEGQAIGVMAVMIDVTEALRAENERLRLSAALEQCPVAVIITDRKGTIDYVNSKFTSLYGYTAAEVRGKNPRILKSGDMSSKDYAGLWSAIGSGKEWRGELRNKKKNGEHCSVSVTISALRNTDGEITHFVGMQEDVTDRKKLEAQLLQAQKMETVGRLAGGVAHDFNNLLTVILGNTEIVLNELAPDDPRRRDLEETRDTARRAADLTRQLLTFSRRQAFEPRPVPVNSLVHGVEKLLRRLLGEDLELKIAAIAEHDSVKADPGQLEQVLVNLAVNARDAMPTGGKLTISTADAKLDAKFAGSHPGAFEGPAIVLTVQDNGSGMTEEVKAHIFEPFFTTKEPGKGTGLGLATCYGIVRQNGGFITVDSEPGRGTEFRVYLPASHGPSAARI